MIFGLQFAFASDILGRAMLVVYLPVIAALISASAALAVALQTRRWVQRDRAEDRALAARDREIAARDETKRRAAERLFAFDPLAGIPDSIGEGGEATAGAIRIGFDAVEPMRHWATTLPLAWRLRIDGQISRVVHFGSPQAKAGLRQDIVDLMNGLESPAALGHDRNSFAFYLSAVLRTERYQNDLAIAATACALAQALMHDLVIQYLRSDGFSIGEGDERYESQEARALKDEVLGVPALCSGGTCAH